MSDRALFSRDDNDSSRSSMLSSSSSMSGTRSLVSMPATVSAEPTPGYDTSRRLFYVIPSPKVRRDGKLVLAHKQLE